jgi:Domain of unknown function (DUF4338)
VPVASLRCSYDLLALPCASGGKFALSGTLRTKWRICARLLVVVLPRLEDGGPRSWIGWKVQQRVRNLQLIVNQSRFLVLHSVRVKGLASKILAKSARQLLTDWERRYGYRPLLLETLVDAQRFRETCYRAANWIHVGQTQGRGRMDREHRAEGLAVKDIYI